MLSHRIHAIHAALLMVSMLAGVSQASMETAMTVDSTSWWIPSKLVDIVVDPLRHLVTGEHELHKISNGSQSSCIANATWKGMQQWIPGPSSEWIETFLKYGQTVDDAYERWFAFQSTGIAEAGVAQNALQNHVTDQQQQPQQWDHEQQEDQEQEHWTQQQWDELAHAFERQRIADADAEFEQQLSLYELAPIEHQWIAPQGQCPNKLMFRYHRFSLDDMEPYFGIRDLYRNEFADVELFGHSLSNDLYFAERPEIYDSPADLVDAFWLRQEVRDQLYIQWVDDRIGYGVFSWEELPEGTFLGIYSGIVRSVNNHFHDSAYLMAIPYMALYDGGVKEAYVLDAATSGSAMRYVNHGYGEAANVEMKTFSDGEAWQVAYLATRIIFPGEQLLVDYGQSYWADRGEEADDLTPPAYPSLFEMAPVETPQGTCPHDKLLSPFHRFVNDDLEGFFGVRTIYRNEFTVPELKGHDLAEDLLLVENPDDYETASDLLESFWYGEHALNSLYVRWINAKAGFGAFAMHEIPAGKYLGVFSGLVRSVYDDFADQSYLMSIPYAIAQEDGSRLEYVIDAAHTGSLLRFVNHAASVDEENLIVKTFNDGEAWHVALIAARTIAADEQLLFHYGDEFWAARGETPLAL